MTEPARHLQAVSPDGELPPDAPQSYSEALSLLGQLDAQIRMMERDLAGKRLRIAELERDREQEAMDDSIRPVVDLIHALWKQSCGKRRPLHFADRERIARALKKLGLRTCLAAVCGAAYDPGRSEPRRNGSRVVFNDLELVFREYAKTKDFASRVPRGWEPNLAKVAALGGVDIKQVERWMSEMPK